MKLNATQLESHLQADLAPLYILSGDETLLVQEAADAIRHAARARGYSEREVMHVDRSFDWSALNDAGDTLSLFAEKRIIELRMPTGKPGDAGRKALLNWVERPPEDTLLLIITGKLEAAIPRAKWFKTLEAAGASLTIWPLEAARLPGWVGARMRERGLQPDVAAVELLAQRVEGNLLAAAQEAEVDFNMSHIDALSKRVPHLCKVSPSTHDYFMEDVHRAGGMLSILGELDKGGLVNRDVYTVHSANLGAALEKWDIGRSDEEDSARLYSAAPGGVRTTKAFRQDKRWELDTDRSTGCIIDPEHAEVLEAPGRKAVRRRNQPDRRRPDIRLAQHDASKRVLRRSSAACR